MGQWTPKKAIWRPSFRDPAWVAARAGRSRSGTFDTKAEAWAWARKVESEMDDGRFVSRTEAEATTLAEALRRYLSDITPTKKPTTAYREGVIGRRLGNHPLAHRVLARIRGKDVADYVRERQGDGAGANTIRLELALLSHLFNTARTAWGLESLTNPVDLVKGQRPRLPQGRAGAWWTTSKPASWRPLRPMTRPPHAGGNVGPLITWAVETVMRRGEIAPMRWEHVDRKARVLLIPETKNGTPRRVPLSTVALGVLDGLPRRIDGRALPPEGVVWGLRVASISQAFERVCAAAGIDGLTFHDLRHEVAPWFFEKGLNPMQVAAITGHKTLQMLKRYTI